MFVTTGITYCMEVGLVFNTGIIYDCSCDLILEYDHMPISAKFYLHRGLMY